MTTEAETKPDVADEAIAKNREAIFNALAQIEGLEFVTVEYNGEGDSGKIEGVFPDGNYDAGNGKLSVAIEWVKVENHWQGVGQEPTVTTHNTTMPLREAIEEFCYDAIEEKFDGWEDGDVGMATPRHHALSSVRKWGGEVGDYMPLHNWFDASKEMVCDFRHRMLRHHAQGIFELERVFGTTITNSNGRVIPTRLIGEQHVKEDFGGFIPSLADWVRAIKPMPWMGKAAKITDEGKVISEGANE